MVESRTLCFREKTVCWEITMPGIYTVHDEDCGYDSGYESDGNTSYCPVVKLGQGTYCEVRLFASSDGKKEIAVMNPRNPKGYSKGEVNNKYDFLKTIYPNARVELIEYEAQKSYRLITSVVAGKPYDALSFYKYPDPNNEQPLLDLFLSALQELRRCHAMGYVFVDLKADNILYDEPTGNSGLVDGGLASRVGSPLRRTFKLRATLEVEKSRTEYPYIAPECWSTEQVLAATSMDVYSLGRMMAQALKHSSNSELKDLIRTCLAINPQDRPSLDEMEPLLSHGNQKQCMSLDEVEVSLRVKGLKKTKSYLYFPPIIDEHEFETESQNQYFKPILKTTKAPAFTFPSIFHRKNTKPTPANPNENQFFSSLWVK